MYQKIVYLPQFKSFRIAYNRNMRMIQAKCLIARFTIKVAVQLFDTACMVVMAQTIFCGAAAVLYLMDDVMGGEEG